MTPQPVHGRRPLLRISRADFKIRLLFRSKRLFDWFPADFCTGFGPEPGPQPTAGFIRWGEGCLRVKAAMRHPLSEAWWGSGDLSVSALLQASCSGSALRGVWWQSTGSVQTSWPSWEIRHLGLISLCAEACRRWGESSLKVSQGAGSANVLSYATTACSMYLNLEIQDFVQEMSNLPREHGWGAGWVIWCFGRSLTACVWIVPTE